MVWHEDDYQRGETAEAFARPHVERKLRCMLEKQHWLKSVEVEPGRFEPRNVCPFDWHAYRYGELTGVVEFKTQPSQVIIAPDAADHLLVEVRKVKAVQRERERLARIKKRTMDGWVVFWCRDAMVGLPLGLESPPWPIMEGGRFDRDDAYDAQPMFKVPAGEWVVLFGVGYHPDFEGLAELMELGT